MSTSIQALLQQSGAKTSSFSSGSRYYNIDTATMKDANGNTITYLRRRFLPQPDQFYKLQEHTVLQGERLDQVTVQYLGDPERYWQICDANNVMNPEELIEEPGSKIKITLPEGIPGNNNA
ncbi:MAG: LysM domain-containing protein [Sphingobacteriaceae bacterium]|nr:MAG: LysM domain-containing protein [Sphingobacteriaceae bacterium]